MGWVPFVAGMVTVAGIYGILSLALNLEFGVAGIINFGVVAFFAIGAYAYTIFTAPRPVSGHSLIDLGGPMWLGMLVAAVVAAVAGFLIGWPTVKLGIEYVALLTFALGEVIRHAAINATNVTNGLRGFTQLAQPLREYIQSSSYDILLMAITLCFLAVMYFFVQRLTESPFGRALRGIRESEEVSLSIGKNVFKMRMYAFVIGCAVSGVAGVLYVWYNTLTIPSLYSAEITFAIWIALLLGGTGNNRGAILGAFVFVAAQELTRFVQSSPGMASTLASVRTMIVGLVLILVMRYQPRGIIPEKKGIFRG